MTQIVSENGQFKIYNDDLQNANYTPGKCVDIMFKSRLIIIYDRKWKAISILFQTFFLCFVKNFSWLFFFPSRSANFFLSAIMLALHSRGQHAFFSFTADSIHILPAMLFHPHLHLLHPENIKDKKKD